MSRKKKLEAGLEGLFSEATESKGKDQLIFSVIESEADSHSLEPPEADRSVPEPLGVLPIVAVEEIEQVEEIAAEERPAAPLPQPETPVPVSESSDATDGREKQLVVFTLAGEPYGLDISSVESIIKMQLITVVPRARAFIEGVTNLRGAVLPVVDLRKRFDMPAEQITNETRIVVVEVAGTTVGMIVDTVTEVIRVSQENIAPPSHIMTTIDSNYI
ncbi:MAG: chemotaxis protein CheW, partial [Anaerolineae bacterium]